MASEYTSGPWGVGGSMNGGGSPYGVYCDDATGNRVADCFPQFSTIPETQAEANARLIAAAPKLLDTLEAWVELVERTIKKQSLFLKLEANSVADFTQALDETRAAIAKVKGEA